MIVEVVFPRATNQARPTTHTTSIVVTHCIDSCKDEELNIALVVALPVSVAVFIACTAVFSIIF